MNTCAGDLHEAWDTYATALLYAIKEVPRNLREHQHRGIYGGAYCVVTLLDGLWYAQPEAGVILSVDNEDSITFI